MGPYALLMPRPSNALKTSRSGYGFVALAAVLWASNGAVAKFLFSEWVSPFQLVQLRLTIAAVSLMVWLLVRRPALLRISRRDILYFVVLGTCGMAAVNIAYMFAISRIQVAAAILLEYLAPAIIAAYGVLFAGERLRPVTITAMTGAVVGCFFAVGAYRLDMLSLNLAGILSGLGAAASFAWWSVHGEYGMRRYDPWTVLLYASAVAALEWNLVHPPLEAFTHAYPIHVWGLILYVGIAGTLIPFGLYLEGINLIRATRASITSTLEPIVAGVLAYLLLGEVMEGLQVLGGGAVIAAIVLLQLQSEEDPRAPALIRAEKEPDGG
jgi:drug/metabolite transporter (DMT)-like permease